MTPLEMREYIATKLYGWTHDGPDGTWREADGTIWRNIPWEWDTEIGDAWDLVEKMRERNWYLTTLGYSWLSGHDVSCTFEHTKYGEITINEVENAPLAICRVAVAALVYEKNPQAGRPKWKKNLYGGSDVKGK